MDYGRVVGQARVEYNELRYLKCRTCGFVQEYHRDAINWDQGLLGTGSGPIYGPYPEGICETDWESSAELRCRCRLAFELKDANLKIELRKFRYREMAHRFGRVMMHLVEQHCGVKEILALKDTIAEYEKEFGYPENVEDEDYDEDERGD